MYYKGPRRPKKLLKYQISKLHNIIQECDKISFSFNSMRQSVCVQKIIFLH